MSEARTQRRQFLYAIMRSNKIDRDEWIATECAARVVNFVAIHFAIREACYARRSTQFISCRDYEHSEQYPRVYDTWTKSITRLRRREWFARRGITNCRDLAAGKRYAHSVGVPSSSYFRSRRFRLRISDETTVIKASRECLLLSNLVGHAIGKYVKFNGARAQQPHQLGRTK